MATATTARRIDLTAIPLDVVMEANEADGTFVVRCRDTDDATLQAAVDAAPDDPTPAREVNDATLRRQAHDSLTTLRTSIDTLKAITDKTNANIGPADTKAVARETRRVARQVLALTRLLIGALDTVDTGTD